MAMDDTQGFSPLQWLLFWAQVPGTSLNRFVTRILIAGAAVILTIIVVRGLSAQASDEPVSKAA